MKIYEQGSYQMGKVANELSFEQQLATLTNSAQLEKLPILRPYAVGFQTLYKNDENTEGIGVGIYMIGKQVIYIPSFYRNNTLKTCLFMVLADTKQFRPATEEWIDYIRVRADSEPGTLIEKGRVPEVRRGAPGSVRARDYLDPILKTAHCNPDGGKLYEILHESATEGPAMHTASPMDLALEFGKSACLTLMDNLANDRRFLNDMLTFYSPDDIKMFKEAALSLYPGMYDAPKAPEAFAKLVMPLEPDAHTLTKEAKDTLMHQGFFIKTASSDFSAVVDTDKTGLEMQNINRPGVYQLFVHGSDDFDTAVVLKPSRFTGEVTKSFPREDRPSSNSSDRSLQGMVAVINKHTGTDHYIQDTSDLVGMNLDATSAVLKKTLEGLGEPLEDLSVLTTGDLIFNPADGASIRLDVWNDYIRTLGDTQWVCTVNLDGPCCSSDGSEVQTKVRVISLSENTNRIALNGSTLMFPKGCRVIKDKIREIERETDRHDDKQSWEDIKNERAKLTAKVTQGYVHLSELNYVTNRMIDSNFRRVKITGDGLKYKISEETNGKSSDDVDFVGQLKEAALHLVETYHVNPDDAVSMLKTASPLVLGPSVEKRFGIEKKAISLSGYTGYEHGSSPYDRPDQISYTERFEPGPEIEVINTEGQSLIANDRQQVLDMIHRAAENGVKEVMDASVLKMLLNTSAPSNLVGDYMKDLTRALDKIGRILMLLFSHAEEFEDQYGDSKMQELVETLQSAQKNLSDVIMFLKTKSLYSVDLISTSGGNGLASGVIH